MEFSFFPLPYILYGIFFFPTTLHFIWNFLFSHYPIFYMEFSFFPLPYILYGIFFFPTTLYFIWNFLFFHYPIFYIKFSFFFHHPIFYMKLSFFSHYPILYMKYSLSHFFCSSYFWNSLFIDWLLFSLFWNARTPRVVLTLVNLALTSVCVEL